MATGGVPERVTVLEAQVQELTEAVRAVLTVLHPAPIKDAKITEVEAARLVSDAIHDLLMEWLTKLGGRVELGGGNP